MLATDGDFNVGTSSRQDLEDLIVSKRDEHIFLSVLGFGYGNYQDDNMETLADKGNGNYAYIDNLLEAKKVLVKEMGGTLYTIAKDVKIQIEFNPEKVKSYRLIGYENRRLNKEDFNDDKKDAGELGAGHTVTALYEIIPAGASGVDSNVDDLKYQTTTSNHAAMSSNELANVKLRYKEPTGNTSQLIVKSVIDNEVAFIWSSNNFRFSSAVASFGMLLRDSKFKGDISYKNVINIAKDAKGKDLEGYRSEFVQLVEKAEMADKNRKNMRVTESTEFRGLDDDGWYKF
jgi:Ca-activated chloride channel family protein